MICVQLLREDLESECFPAKSWIKSRPMSFTEVMIAERYHLSKPWQNLSVKPFHLSRLIGTAEANHDSLCPRSNKRLEPCGAVFRRACAEAVSSCLHLIRNPVVAFNERAQLAFRLRAIGVDVERGIQTTVKVAGVSPHLLPQGLETFPIRHECLG